MNGTQRANLDIMMGHIRAIKDHAKVLYADGLHYQDPEKLDPSNLGEIEHAVSQLRRLIASLEPRPCGCGLKEAPGHHVDCPHHPDNPAKPEAPPWMDEGEYFAQVEADRERFAEA